MKLLFVLGFSFFLSLPAFAEANDPQREADAHRLIKSELATSGQILFAIGASNTGGFGLKFGMRDRVLYHLVAEHSDAVKGLQSKHVCIGMVLDRFFPSAFPMLADPSAMEADIAEAVVSVMTPMLKSGCTLIVSDLFDPSSLKEGERTRVSKTLPLERLSQALQMADSTGARIRTVNKTLSEIAAKQPKIVLFSFNQVILPLADTNDPASVHLNDFFQNGGDDVHINYSGQALFFNIFVRPTLETVSGAKISTMKYQSAYSERWMEDVIREAATLSPHETGTAKLLNQTALSEDTHQITGTKKKGFMTKAGDLVLVDVAVREALSTSAASFAISRHRAPSGGREYELDLSKQAYTKIVLKQSATDSKVFVGMGTDHWGPAIGLSRYWSPALTNYVFVLTEVDDTHVNVVWKVVPQLQVNGKVQKISKEVREAELPDPDKIWIPEMEKNIKEYNRLEYLIETEVEWFKK